MTRVVLLCGPAGSGKSVRARALEAQGWARLSVDAVAWGEGHRDHPLPDAVTDRIQADLRRECVDLVRAGRDVVVDLSFWSRAMRDRYRDLLRPLGVVPLTTYLATPRGVVLDRLARRTGAGPDDVVVTAETAQRYLDGFEVPTPAEGPLEIVEHRADLPTRPVLAGFHPDPTVCRVGETYYLACSSFEYAPGVPIFRSSDLVTWEQVGSALDRPDQLALDGVAPSGGIYAPTLRHHDGLFWLVTTHVSDGGGHLLVTATDPAGPWSEPVRVIGAGGIDPDLAWDDDGTCYLTWSDAGIRQAELDPATGCLLSEPRRVWDGTGGKDPEGPHLYRVGASWYLLIAEGGTSQGHAVTIARGPSPSGPFEPCPHNPLVTARGIAGPVQHTGHADLVTRPDGTWAMVFLGVRPEGSFPGWHVLGRETFAADVAWEGGWPRLDRPIEPVGPVAPDGPGATPVDHVLPDARLPVDWVGAAVFPDEVLRWDEERWVLAAPHDGAGRVFVGRRQEHPVVTVRAEIDATTGTGGLEIRLDPTHSVTLEVTGGTVRAVARVGSLVSVLGEHDTRSGVVPELELRVTPSTAPAHSRERGPDEVVAVVHGDGGPLELGRLDGRYLSTEVAGGFTGRMVGLTCAAGQVAVRRFAYSGRDEG